MKKKKKYDNLDVDSEKRFHAIGDIFVRDNLATQIMLHARTRLFIRPTHHFLFDVHEIRLADHTRQLFFSGQRKFEQKVGTNLQLHGVLLWELQTTYECTNKNYISVEHYLLQVSVDDECRSDWITQWNKVIDSYHPRQILGFAAIEQIAVADNFALNRGKMSFSEYRELFVDVQSARELQESVAQSFQTLAVEPVVGHCGRQSLNITWL